MWAEQANDMEPKLTKDPHFYRPPVVSVMVVVLVLTAMVLVWQLALRPRIVPTAMIAGGTVTLTHLPVDRASAADQVVAAPGFLSRLRQAIPEHRDLLATWTRHNTRFSINESASGQAVLSYAGPGYAIRQFDFQAMRFEQVGTQKAPSKALARHLIAKQEQLGEDMAAYVTREAEKVKLSSDLPKGTDTQPSIGPQP